MKLEPCIKCNVNGDQVFEHLGNDRHQPYCQCGFRGPSAIGLENSVKCWNELYYILKNAKNKTTMKEKRMASKIGFDFSQAGEKTVSMEVDKPVKFVITKMEPSGMVSASLFIGDREVLLTTPATVLSREWDNWQLPPAYLGHLIEKRDELLAALEAGPPEKLTCFSCGSDQISIMLTSPEIICQECKMSNGSPKFYQKAVAELKHQAEVK